MFSMIKTEAFVIKKHNFREFDRTYIVYTKELGKISLLVRGARRIKSKLSPNLENFSEVKLNFIKGRIYNHLAGVTTLSNNSSILKDSEKIAFIYDCFLLLDKFVKQDEKDERIFELVGEVLNALNKASRLSLDGKNILNKASRLSLDGKYASSLCHCEQSEAIPSANKPTGLSRREYAPRNDTISEILPKIQIYFFWRLIDFLGYRPQIENCALCGINISLKRDAFRRPLQTNPEILARSVGTAERLSAQEDITVRERECVGTAERLSASSLQIKKNLDFRFNITDNIIICSKCAGQGIIIKEETLKNLQNVFKMPLLEFLKTQPTPELIGITNKAREIKLSEL